MYRYCHLDGQHIAMCEGCSNRETLPSPTVERHRPPLYTIILTDTEEECETQSSPEIEGREGKRKDKKGCPLCGFNLTSLTEFQQQCHVNQCCDESCYEAATNIPHSARIVSNALSFNKKVLISP